MSESLEAIAKKRKEWKAERARYDRNGDISNWLQV